MNISTPPSLPAGVLLTSLCALSPAASGQSLMPYSNDFETVPNPNVPNVALGSDAVPGQWYSRYGDLTAADGHGSDGFSVGVYTPAQGGNKWPASDPNRSNVLRVGYANDSVKTLVTLGLDDKWDSNETYRLRFQWAIADHGTNTGRDFQVKIFGCATYNLGFPGAPEQFRSKPTDPIAGGAEIKAIQLDQGAGVSLLDTVYTEEILITGADIDAAGQNGNQIYFGFEKPTGTEFYAVDNLTFDIVPAADADNDGLSDSAETGGNQAGGTLGPYNGPSDAGTFVDAPDSDGDGIEDGDEVFGESVSGFGYTSNPTLADTDGDGIDDGDEVNGTLNVLFGNQPTDPDSVDTDGDGIDDDVEINITLTNPAVADTDDDGLTDGEEDVNQDGVVDPSETSAVLSDTDSDNLPDKWEIDNNLDPNSPGDDTGDPDFDLLVNIDEYNGGVESTDPNDPDSDNDGLTDGEEWNNPTYLLNLLSRDTDNDGLGDKFEVDNGLDPTTDQDFDLDTFSDADEVLFFGTDPKDVNDFPGDADSPGPGGLTPIQFGGSVGATATFGLAGTLEEAIVNEAAQGGSNIDYPTGVIDFSVVYPDLFAAAGTEVSLTGFAWALTGGTSRNDDGEILVEFYDPGADGVFDGVDTDTLVGSATGSLTVGDTNGVVYWNFDSPINFTSEGTALAVRFLGSGKLRIKAQNNFATGLRYSNQGDGPIENLNSVRLSIGGTVSVPGGITLSLADFNAGQPVINWTPPASVAGVDLYRSTDLQSWTGPISTNDQDGTHTDTTAPAGKAFYLAVPSGDPAP